MKQYKLNNNEVFEYNFHSMSDYIEHLLTQPINYKLFKTLTSALEDKSYREFTKTKNFEEAINLCRFGYFENFEQFYNDKILLESYISSEGIGIRTTNDYVGFCPDIKAYTEGNPLNMINKVPLNKNQISIYFCTGYSGADTEKMIHNRGVITLNLIESLERLGYAVDLHFFDLTKEKAHDINKKQYLLTKWLLKKENERINSQLIYFPMCHPAFDRRLYFRLTEQTFGLSCHFKNSYGCRCSLEEIEEILGNDDKRIIINWPRDMGIKGLNLIEDAENMLNIIEERNMQKTLKMPCLKKDKIL